MIPPVNVIADENVFVAFLKATWLDNALSGILAAEILAPDMVGAFVPNVIVCVPDAVIPPVNVVADENVFIAFLKAT